jgi:hypothetical protein
MFSLKTYRHPGGIRTRIFCSSGHEPCTRPPEQCFSLFQSGGEIIERNGRKRKLFYGMASATAMKKHAGGVADYRASEGKTVEVVH